MITSLNSIANGTTVHVKSIKASDLKVKLLEMGFCEGKELRVLYRAPFGDLLREAVLQRLLRGFGTTKETASLPLSLEASSCFLDGEASTLNGQRCGIAIFGPSAQGGR